MEQLRDLDAYVLLGDPGAGKSFSFRAEAELPGCDYVSARDFMTLKPRPEWQGKTLFIDGLDETRAGGLDGRTPLDSIRARLEGIAGTGRQRFRISCREADWLGASDQRSLEQVAPNNKIEVFRLDPLTSEQIIGMVAAHQPDITPQEFVESARKHNLEALLQNPQTLFMLVKAVGGNSWPESREDVFRLACEKLIVEPNLEHRAATRRMGPSRVDLLGAAGYLCAIQLISDVTGFSIDDNTIPGAVVLNEIPWKDLPLRDVVQTRVFSATTEGLFLPVHRSIAEYLGASFLAQAVREGLSIKRVLALMQGSDGGIVSGLRGLHAWLAFHLPEHRSNLNARDPLGVTLYGAVGRFTVLEKKQLLDAIALDIERSYGQPLGDWNTPPAIGLVTPDMTETLRAILESPSRLLKDQLLSSFVVEAIEHGSPAPELGAVLLRTVQDTTRWSSVRQRALRAYARAYPAETESLLQLANDIQSNKTEDADDGLLGEILYRVFPMKIGPSEILDFLHPPKQPNFIGSYYMFWSHDVANRIGIPQIAVLLDALAVRTDLWHERSRDLMLKSFVGSVLVKGIQTHGESISADRLFGWLGIPADDDFDFHLDNGDRTAIRNWIEARPEIYKDLLVVAVEHVRRLDNYWNSFLEITQRFCNATPPSGIVEFWLHLAEKEPNRDLANVLFRQALRPLLHEGSNEHPIGFFSYWTASRPAFAATLAGELYVEIPDWRKSDAERRRTWHLEEEARRQQWISHFREEVSKTTPHPRALHDLARAYDGHLLEAEGNSPRERLAHFLGNDQNLVQASLSALKKTLERTDLPPVQDILDLAGKDRMHLIRLPVLAAMDEIWRESPDNVDGLSDEILAKIAAFRLTEGTGKPDWFTHLVKDRPEVISPVLTAYVSRMLRARKEHVNGLWQVAFEDNYEGVAKIATWELLNAFPVRLAKGQAQSLEYVLKAALRYCKADELRKAVAQRLRNRSLDVAQRTYWLACGLIVDPATYGRKLEHYVGASHERRQHLGEFLTGREDRRVLPQNTKPETLGLLVRLLGPGCSPERPEEMHWVTPGMRSADLVRSLVDRLSAMPGASATLELERLENASDLSEWRTFVHRAAYVQQISQREASFHHPTSVQVVETLAKRSPANAADLAAIVLEILEEIAKENRDGDADGYKLYWNLKGSYPDRPKTEEECRNVLLSQLRPCLEPLGIDAQPEARHADGKRADIRITFRTSSFAASIPIEIKKDSDRNLWRAISNQLIPRYTRDPDATGRGIYLVLWFGELKKPRTASELRTQLEATIDPMRRALISVVVFDCAAPSAMPRQQGA